MTHFSGCKCLLTFQVLALAVSAFPTDLAASGASQVAARFDEDAIIPEGPTPQEAMIAIPNGPQPQEVVQEDSKEEPSGALVQDDESSLLRDYGKTCYHDDECSSGICGTACSSLDFSAQHGQTCMCPKLNKASAKPGDSDDDQKHCCGCMRAGIPGVTKCKEPVPGFAAAMRSTTVQPGLPAYARLEVEHEEPQKAPKNVLYQETIGMKQSTGTKGFGDQCNSADDCESGICGTSSCHCYYNHESLGPVLNKFVAKFEAGVCSCSVPCQFPYKCCGGCVVGKDPRVQSCPAGTMVTTFKGRGPYGSVPGHGVR